MAAKTRQIIKRLAKGPCVFCRRGNVPFTKEDLPPETVVGEKAMILVDWVCGECNNKFSVEDDYFAKHYHGAVGRVVYGVTVKNRKGAQVDRKDFWGKFQLDLNTVQFQIKTKKERDDLLRDLDLVEKRQPTRIEIENRVVNTRRIGKCLAKMALEALACYAPETALAARFDPIRRYACGRGPLKFLPFALGNPKGEIGVRLVDVKFDGSDKRVPVSLIFLPAASYAVQLSDYDDLHPLWHVAKFFKMIFDEDGKRTQRSITTVDFEFPDSLNS